MHNLKRLLQPKSVALFGGLWAKNVYMQLRKSSFNGTIWPVHPKKKKLGQHDCFKDVETLPYPPDAAFIGVNRHKTIEIVRKLDRMGAGGAVCFASGFSETEIRPDNEDGHKLQNKLTDAATKLAILGPNCYGFLNYLDNIRI